MWNWRCSHHLLEGTNSANKTTLYPTCAVVSCCLCLSLPRKQKKTHASILRALQPKSLTTTPSGSSPNVFRWRSCGRLPWSAFPSLSGQGRHTWFRGQTMSFSLHVVISTTTVSSCGPFAELREYGSRTVKVRSLDTRSSYPAAPIAGG